MDNVNSSASTDACFCPSVSTSLMPDTTDIFSTSDFYIGLVLALSSTIFIGSSFIIKKKGLLKLNHGGSLRAGFGGHGYLKDWLWWAGFLTLGLGEVLNFIAYAFAPATLVTPLGAFSVLVSNLLASRFLKEKLNLLGKISCLLCIMGSTIIVLHAPKEGYLANMDELQTKMQDTGFIVYIAFVILITFVLIFYLGPAYGQSNVLIYILICSFLGSLSVLASKGLGIAIRETASGYNAMGNWLTWFCLIVVIICIAVQTNYLNKALDIYNAALITSIFYVTFTICVISASAILFKEWKSMSVENVIGTLCGFTTVITAIFTLHAFKDVDISIRERFRRHNGDKDNSVSDKLLPNNNTPVVQYESATHSLEFPRD